MKPIREIPQLVEAVKLLYAESPFLAYANRVNNVVGKTFTVAVVSSYYANVYEISKKARAGYIEASKGQKSFSLNDLDLQVEKRIYKLKLKERYRETIIGSIDYSKDKSKVARPTLSGTEYLYIKEDVFLSLQIDESTMHEVVENNQKLVYFDIVIGPNMLSLDVTKSVKDRKAFLVDLDFFTLRSLTRALNLDKVEEETLKSFDHFGVNDES